MNNYVENLASTDVPGLESSIINYYETYPDVSVEPNLQRYKDGEIQYLSIPSERTQDGKLWTEIFHRLSSDNFLLGDHAESSHTIDSKYAVSLINENLPEGNVTVGVKAPKTEGREREASRIIISTQDPVEKYTDRYLHFQMAIEIADQIKRQGTDPKTLTKYLKVLASEKPGFALMLVSELVSLNPNTENLNIKTNDIYNIVPNLSPNRESDRRLIKDLGDLISGLKIFNSENHQRCISILSQKYPNERSLLNKSFRFKEIVKPIVVFESGLNILTEEIFPNKGIRLTGFIAQKYRTPINSFTTRVVTSYVEHYTVQQLGRIHDMLSKDNKFLGT